MCLYDGQIYEQIPTLRIGVAVEEQLRWSRPTRYRYTKPPTLRIELTVFKDKRFI